MDKLKRFLLQMVGEKIFRRSKGRNERKEETFKVSGEKTKKKDRENLRFCYVELIDLMGSSCVKSKAKIV